MQSSTHCLSRTFECVRPLRYPRGSLEHQSERRRLSTRYARRLAVPRGLLPHEGRRCQRSRGHCTIIITEYKSVLRLIGIVLSRREDQLADTATLDLSFDLAFMGQIELMDAGREESAMHTRFQLRHDLYPREI